MLILQVKLHGDILLRAHVVEQPGAPPAVELAVVREGGAPVIRVSEATAQTLLRMLQLASRA
jgi:hypothetical protein